MRLDTDRGGVRMGESVAHRPVRPALCTFVHSERISHDPVFFLQKQSGESVWTVDHVLPLRSDCLLRNLERAALDSSKPVSLVHGALTVC